MSSPGDAPLSLGLSGGKTERRRSTGPVLFQVTLSQTCKSWRMENRLGQSKAVENRALWEQWPLRCGSGRVEPLPLCVCHGENGLNGSLADFLMTSVVSSRCAKNISCNGDL